MWSVIRLRTFRRSQKHERKMKKTASERQRNLHRQFGDRAPTNNIFLRSVYWALRGIQYWLCFYDDEVEVDVEDLLSNPFNTQPPSLDQLHRFTGFNRQWLMFLYRNFKQRCSTGRMSESQWRGVFRLIFPSATDYQFADRLYKAIAIDRGHTQITFEDLVLCLWELTEGGRSSQYSVNTQISATAQFVFTMMGPDERGFVNEASFIEYTRCIFALCASRHHTDNSAALGLPTGSIYRSKTAEEEVRPVSNLIRRYAMERFKSLDEDGDGMITIADIERQIELNKNNLRLRSEHDIMQQAGTSS